MKLGLGMVCCAATLVGCIFNGDRPCGPNMWFDTATGVCVCADNAIAVGGGCTACAADEVVVSGTCACAPGETKSEAGVCAVAPGLGSTCDAATPCQDATYDYCAIRGSAGSCTKLCAVDADCPDAYVCADWEAVPSCRIFTGYGAACVTDECATYDANYCISGHCAVHDCTIAIDDCPRNTVCCDFSSYGIGTLCVPPGNCP